MLTEKNKPSIFILNFLIVMCMASCMSLEKVTIENLRLEYDKKPLRLRGTNLPIGVSVITADQKRLTTWGFSHGRLKWSNFNISVQGGWFSNGKIIIPPESASDSISVSIVSKHHPEWKINEVIALNHLLDIRTSVVEPVVWAPDESFKIMLSAHYDNGQVYSNKLTSSLIKKMDLLMETEGGQFSGGKFNIYEDFENIPGHTVFFKLEQIGKPSIADSFARMLNYIKHYYYSRSEFSGFNGFSGSIGSSGASGSSDGECGTNGGHGGDGNRGEHGKDGDDLNVFVDSYFDSILQADLVYVEVDDLSCPNRKKYLINPNGGSILVSTSGGDGGNGGSGGNGGNGGSGANGKEIKWEEKDSTGVHYYSKIERGGQGGDGGDAGYGGNGGDGGYGGDIFIHYTAKAKLYLSIIVPESIGGDGGRGGSAGLPGSGGSGGSGNPSGSSGRSGNSGRNGLDGRDGARGQVIYTLVEN
jgi:hypothetical protein